MTGLGGDSLLFAALARLVEAEVASRFNVHVIRVSASFRWRRKLQKHSIFSINGNSTKFSLTIILSVCKPFFGTTCLYEIRFSFAAQGRSFTRLKVTHKWTAHRQK
jgi:hypothetical protein